jgi:hypothetical protein
LLAYSDCAKGLNCTISMYAYKWSICIDQIDPLYYYLLSSLPLFWTILMVFIILFSYVCVNYFYHITKYNKSSFTFSFYFLNDSHSDWGDIETQYSFVLHFSDGKGYWTIIHVFIDHLYFLI